MIEFKEGNITVKFSGEGVAQDWDYRCYDCGKDTVIAHTRLETMRGRECPCCKGELGRRITSAPALDADFHESQKAHNLGWD